MGPMRPYLKKGQGEEEGKEKRNKHSCEIHSYFVLSDMSFSLELALVLEQHLSGYTLWLEFLCLSRHTLSVRALLKVS